MLSEDQFFNIPALVQTYLSYENYVESYEIENITESLW